MEKKRVILLTSLLLFAGCTATQPRDFVYRNWDFHIRDSNEVTSVCRMSPIGCTFPGFGIAYAIDNTYVIHHECSHIDVYSTELPRAVAEHRDPKQVYYGEVMKDVLASMFFITELGTLFSGSGGDCGDDTGLSVMVTREQIIQQRSNFELWRRCEGHWKRSEWCQPE